VVPHIDGFPFKKQMRSDPVLKRWIGCQVRRFDFPFVEQWTQELQLWFMLLYYSNNSVSC
jgi:hypothetical protein